MFHLRTRFPALHRFASLLALWAILVPFGISLIHTPAAAQNFIHICGGRHDHGPNHKKSDHKVPSCPICKNVHSVDMADMPPMVDVSALSLPYTKIAQSQHHAFGLSFGGVFVAQPRAPPAFV